MKTLSTILGITILFICIASCHPSVNTAEGQGESKQATQAINDLSDTDKMFLEIAGSAGIMEVELGKIAIKTGTQKEVVGFGEMMVEEHTKINQEFKQLLDKLGVQVPEGMNERNKNMIKEHEGLLGKEFDKKYVQTMIDDHKLATDKFQEALAIAKNEDYRKFLSAMIPVVKSHYEMAQQLQQKLN